MRNTTPRVVFDVQDTKETCLAHNANFRGCAAGAVPWKFLLGAEV